MEISLHQLEIFLTIARERSFSKAAERLRISQPSVSIQVKTLSDSLGVKLFERVGRGVSLTREGVAVLERAKQISEMVSSLHREINPTQREQFLVGCNRVPNVTLIPIAVARFKSQYPNVDISIKAGRSYEVANWLLQNKADIGLIEGDPAASGLQKEPWYEDEVVLVISPRSPLLKRRRLSLKEILEEPFVLQSSGTRPPFIERFFTERGLTIKKPVTVGSREAVKVAVIAGLGVSFLPKSIIDTELHAGLLKTRKIPGVEIKYPVNMVYRRDKELPETALAFLDILRGQTVPAPIPASARSGLRKKRVMSAD